MRNDIKHTPGPWQLQTSSNDFSDTWFAFSKTQVKIFEVAAGNYTGKDEESAYKEAEANANLIAAAPDMLEALKEAEKELEACYKRIGIDWPTRISRIIKSAIAKAEGKQ